MGQKLVIILVLAALAVGGYFAVNFLTGDDQVEVETPRVKDDQNDPVPVVTTREKVDEEFRPTPPGAQEKESVTTTAPAGPENQLIGTVFDEKGQPLSGAKISVFLFQKKEPNRIGRFKIAFDEKVIQETESGEDGSYLITGLESPAKRPFSMRISHPGRATIIKDHVGLGMVVDVHMMPGVDVDGIVIDRDSGQPIAGVRVEGNMARRDADMAKYMRWRRVVTTDAEGKYHFEGVPPGPVTVLLEHEDYEQLFYGKDSGLVVKLNEKNHFEFKMKKGIILNGLVVDAVSGKPIKGAEVILKEIPFIPSQRERTGALGKFTMRGVRRGHHEMIIRAKGFTQYSEQVLFGDKEMAEEVVFKLKPAGQASGLVVDANGNPIPGAEIYVAEELQIFRKVRNFAEAKTDEQGRFTVTGLNDGMRYRLCAKAPGYALGASDDVEGIGGEMVTDVIIQLDPGATIQGVVTDSIGGPIPGVDVTLEVPPFDAAWFPKPLTEGQKHAETVTTDENGFFAFKGLYTGRFHLTPDHPDYQSIRPKAIQVGSANESINSDFTLKLGHSIAGRVTDEFGSPVKGATVRAMLAAGAAQSVTARTDEDGKYRLRRLRDVAYRVVASSEEGVAPPIEKVPADSSNVDFVLERFGKLEGKVYASTSGEPVRRFKVRILPTTGIKTKRGVPDTSDRMSQKKMRSSEAYKEVAITSEDGTFTIEKVHPGDYYIQILSDDYREGSRPSVSVQPAQTTVVPPFGLAEGARYEGQFTDTTGAPLNEGAVTIRFTAAPGSVQRTTIGPDGKPVRTRATSSWEGKQVTLGKNGFFSVGGLPPGKIRVSFRSDRYCMPSMKEIALGNTGVTREDFQVARAARVVVDVADENGDPVPNCTAEIFTAEGLPANVDGRRAYGRGDLRGRLAIEKLQPGRYVINVRHFNYETRKLTVDLAPGEEYRGKVTLPLQH